MPFNSVDYGMMPPTINRLCGERGERERLGLRSRAIAVPDFFPHRYARLIG